MAWHDALNSADYERIEAAIRDLISTTDKKYPAWIGRKAYFRTLDKLERINKTGKYTVQK